MGIVNKSTPSICMLHIGKTGGSYLRSILKHNEARWTRPLHLLGHGATLKGTAKRFGADRQLAFVVRDPVTRFSSAFYSRQRQGRPTYQSLWSAEEAAAFLWFETAEELALALASKNEREKSAALFAFDAIQHLKGDLRHYLGGVETLLAARDNIAVCVDLAHLDAHLPAIMARLGLPDFDMPPKPKAHTAPAPAPKLNPQAERALRAHWAEEFELYDVACDIARQLEFGPADA
ncbi:hypothetical protein BDE40_2731 [Litoreibacter halocynthiae]|uniref:Sulfotransferase family protein n=1 Tax=Litoreibacter halocynthiae TaxID=1242689 RepID=A0A4R7LH31_9RHOB|nr:hypothetical protein [Litoreibacter halocynthiae]TDT73952.1 hypothetical protein BDE40_2731 [Litoreibacter halocynthiae]